MERQRQRIYPGSTTGQVNVVAGTNCNAKLLTIILQVKWLSVDGSEDRIGS
jgi:hypothetical protein